MQVLTLCRFGSDWVFRDVTGEIYGRSADIRDTYDAAQRMARRTGALVELSTEAEIHYRAAMASLSVDNEASPPPESRHGFRAAFARLRARRRRK
ncbi:hypothetical protein AB6806_19785 [Bosea sp. RCC_152_1]|uniref:hypothetical protein n=1 Tax=Bosea sp. RCC_152_1 TaxID=3239228 RepID=UPI003525F6EA